MGYQLGVDLGTTYSAAAIGRNGRVEVTTLGTANPVMPSVVLLRADGEVLVGEVAVRRGLAEPTRVAREFKRRLGDPTPLVLGGTPYGAESLMGHLLHAIVATVVEREGEEPDRVVLTHPANFGPYKLEQMREVARLAGLDLDKTSFLTEPQAAAVSYASRNRVDAGEIVAIYDFGGGTFDAALVQRTDTGFELIGRPEGMERFGGIDIDAALIAHVDQSLDGALSALDPSDPEVQGAISRLREDCRSAKEALSGDTDTSISVSMPGMQTQVRLTRAELEDMVRPRLVETVDALERAVRSAGLTMDKVSRVLLVGGSSRMPIVAEMIRTRTGRPISVDAHPKFAIALGAAGHGATAVDAPALTATPVPVASPSSGGPPSPVAGAPAVVPPPLPGAGPDRTPAPSTPPKAPGADKSKLYVIGGIAAAVVLAIVGFVVFSGGGDDDPSTDDTEETTDDTTDETTDDTDGPDPTTDVTTANLGSMPVTQQQVEQALIDLGDLPDSTGFTQGATFDLGDDICGELPVHRPRMDAIVSYERSNETDSYLSIINSLEYYESSTQAREVLAQHIELTKLCATRTESLQGREFNVTTVILEMDQETLDAINPVDADGKIVQTCTQGAIEIQVFRTIDEGEEFTFDNNVAILQCANVLTYVSTGAAVSATEEQQTEAFILQTAGLNASADNVARLQLLP